MAFENNGLQALEAEHPEWKPWLAVISEVLREAADRKWEAFVPSISESSRTGVPLLTRAKLTLDKAAVGEWTKRLMRVAYESGAPKMASLAAIRSASIDSCAWF